MAKYFGTITDEELAELPESVQKAIKDGSATADEVATLKTQLQELKDNPHAPKPPVIAPETPKWNPSVTADQELLCDTRMEQHLMNFKTGRDKTQAVAVQLFEEEIRKSLNTSHPFNRSSIDYVRNIVDLVKGRHMQEILADIANTSGERKFAAFTETANGNGGDVQVIKKGGESLTAEQKKAADQWGMSHDEYAASFAEVNG